MAVVPPRDEWSLPAGFAYDPLQDAVVDATGAVLTNYGDYYAAGYLYIVPQKQSADSRLLAIAGLVPSGTMVVAVWGDDLTTVRRAYAVELDGEWYDVVDAGNRPAGIGGGLWSWVTLRRRA
jgi:hypothetical protein